MSSGLKSFKEVIPNPEEYPKVILQTVKKLGSQFKLKTDVDVTNFGQELCGLMHGGVLYEPSQLNPGFDVSRSLFLVSNSHRVKFTVDGNKVFVTIGKGKPFYDENGNLVEAYDRFTDDYSLAFETSINSKAKINNMVVTATNMLTGVETIEALVVLPDEYQQDFEAALDTVSNTLDLLEAD